MGSHIACTKLCRIPILLVRREGGGGGGLSEEKRCMHIIISILTKLTCEMHI